MNEDLTIGELAGGAADAGEPMPDLTSTRPTWSTILTARTGAGSIDDYTDHPMNWAGSHAWAQVIRGLSGIFEGLDWALVDIILGLVRIFAPDLMGKKEAENDDPTRDDPGPDQIRQDLL